MKTQIKATATRDGKWWIADFAIDGKEYGTQGKTLEKLEAMVKDAASLMTGKPGTQFTVDFEIAGLDQERILNYRQASKEAKQAEEKLSLASRRAASSLIGAGLTLRDVGKIMNISFQRVSQLVAEAGK